MYGNKKNIVKKWLFVFFFFSQNKIGNIHELITIIVFTFDVTMQLVDITRCECLGKHRNELPVSV